MGPKSTWLLSLAAAAALGACYQSTPSPRSGDEGRQDSFTDGSGLDVPASCLTDEDCGAMNPCLTGQTCDPASGTCRGGVPLDDGTACRAGNPRGICMDGLCVDSVCGDGYLDRMIIPPEECDDGNPEHGDGCEPDTCRFTCHADSECDDGRECTVDRCLLETTHTCEHTTGLEEPCRPSAGFCDPAEYCEPPSLDCPPDLFLAEGTPCDDGKSCSHYDACDGQGRCAGVSLDRALFLSVGEGHTCAVMTTREVKCWGQNQSGQLGDGTATSMVIPVLTQGLDAPAETVAAGGSHTCALLDTGGILCWGSNRYGQLGRSSPSSSLLPLNADHGPPPGTVAALSAGNAHSCALLRDGTAMCWGRNESGELGDGTYDSRSVAAPIYGLPEEISSISARGNQTCALTVSGAVLCWGSTYCGPGESGPIWRCSIPYALPGLSEGVLAVVAGDTHVCAIAADGQVLCWGDNDWNQLGDGTNTDRTRPAPVLGIASGAVALAASAYSTCALMDDGGLRCWGFNCCGQVGNGSYLPSSQAADVTDLDSAVTVVGTSTVHTCAVLDTGEVSCWGCNYDGEVGHPYVVTTPTPVDVFFCF